MTDADMLFLNVLCVTPYQMHLPWLSSVQQRSYAKATLYLVAAQCSMSPQGTTLQPVLHSSPTGLLVPKQLWVLHNISFACDRRL